LKGDPGEALLAAPWLTLWRSWLRIRLRRLTF